MQLKLYHSSLGSPSGGTDVNVSPVGCPRSGSELRFSSETSTEPGRVLYDD